MQQTNVQTTDKQKSMHSLLVLTINETTLKQITCICTVHIESTVTDDNRNLMLQLKKCLV